MRKLSDVIENVIHPLLKDIGVTKIKIFLNWDNIVGEEISKIATPYKMNYSPESESFVLYLEIKNSAFGPKIYHLSTMIIENITIFLGYKAVSEIKIKQCF